MRPKITPRPKYPRIGQFYKCPVGTHPAEISIYDLQNGQIALRIFASPDRSERLFVMRSGEKLLILNSDGYYPAFFPGLNPTLEGDGTRVLVFPSHAQITLIPWAHQNHGFNDSFTARR